MQKAGVSQKVLAEFNAAKQSHLAGNVADAERVYRTLLARNPGLNEVLHPLGIALQQLGRHAEAEAVIARWLAVSPKDAGALANRGNSLLALGRVEDAIASYDKALLIQPNDAEIRCILANAYRQAGNIERAEAGYRQVLLTAPSHAMTLFNLGCLLCDVGRRDDGIQVYEEALRHHPELVEVMVNLGSQLPHVGRADDALKLLREAVRLRPTLPEAQINLGTQLYEQHGDLEGAEKCFLEVLKLVPNARDALNNLCNIYMNTRRFAEAEAVARRLLEHHPDSSTAHGTAAGLFLIMGKLEEGWQHFEWRWLRPGLPVPLRDFRKPVWEGEDICDKTILLHHEQGLGDSIQFIRFVSLIRARAKHVIVEVPPNLRALYKPVGEIAGVTLTNWSEPLPPFDVHLPLMSTAYRLGVTVDTIPNPIPYLFADPERVAKWRDRLPNAEFRIGVVWQGKAGVSIDRGRSYGLRNLAPIARIPGVKLISMQKGYGLDQLADLPEGMEVVTLGDDFDAGDDAFLDTAAVMQNVDLIISSDTSVAHLAGALGRPVWVPLKAAPDWRWLDEREDSPWYAGTMRLFRQKVAGEWDEVFARLAADVAALAAGDKTKLMPPAPPPAVPAAPYPPVPVPPLPERLERALLLDHTPQDITSIGLRQAVTRFGVMCYPATDFYVGRSLELYGEWSIEEGYICQSVLRPGDTVVEAGANVGAHTLLLASAVGPQGHVHAFEPQKVINDILTWNLRTNNHTNVTVHHAGVGAEIGVLHVPPVDYDQIGNFGGISLNADGFGQSVPVVTLDSLNLPSLRLLKADVEGMEIAVLEGGARTIERYRPFLYLEYGGKLDTDKLLEKIVSLGYRIWQHNPPIYNPNNFNKNPENHFPQIASFNIFCAPAEREIVVVGMQELMRAVS